MSILDIKPKVVTISLQDKKLALLKQALETLAPVKHYKALYKAKDALKTIQLTLAQDYGYKLHTWIDGKSETIYLTGEVINNCQDLYNVVEETIKAYAEPNEISFYLGKFTNAIEHQFNSYEMKEHEFNMRKKLMVKALEQALDAIKLLTPEGIKVEIED